MRQGNQGRTSPSSAAAASTQCCLYVGVAHSHEFMEPTQWQPLFTGISTLHYKLLSLYLHCSRTQVIKSSTESICRAAQVTLKRSADTFWPPLWIWGLIWQTLQSLGLSGAQLWLHSCTEVCTCILVHHKKL